jgi:hypothetical protein
MGLIIANFRKDHYEMIEFDVIKLKDPLIAQIDVESIAPFLNSC